MINFTSQIKGVNRLYVGTNDAGASENDPTSGGAGGNNMKLVTENRYDDGLPGGVASYAVNPFLKLIVNHDL